MSKQLKLTAAFGIFFVLSTLISNKIFAQTTANGIFFQAVARDNFSNPAKDRKIYIESSIIQYTATGTKVLIEQHEATTDETGVFNISLGNGKRSGGSAANLTNIDWAMGPYYLSLKIAITPRAPIPNWDYTKEWIDLGTTPFGTVPYALYAGSAAGLNDKLSIADTTSMLAIYAKMIAVKTIENTVNTKIGSTDTAAMLAPYKKMVNEIIASNITSLTADAINTALNSKVNLTDSTTRYVTPRQLAANAFDPTNINNSIKLKANNSDVNNSLIEKVSIADSTTRYVTPMQLAAKTFDIVPINASIATKVSLADSTIKYVTPTQLAAKTFDLAPINTSIATKVSLADSTTLYVTPTQLAAKTFDLAPINTSIATKVDKVIGKGLSSNDFTTAEKTKLAAISGNNTGDQDLSGFATITALGLKASTSDINTSLLNKLNISDTSAMLSDRIKRDTSFLSNRINLKETELNKSNDIAADALSESKYPSVKAIKTYIDGATSSGVVDADPTTKGKIKLAGDLSGTSDIPTIATGAITTNKISDAAITNIKIATGISASKVGLGNLTNNAQIYSLNGLTNQVQSFGVGSIGTSPSFSSTISTHTLHIPMASSTSVTAGLISNTDWNNFNNKLSSFTETDPSIPAWAKTTAKPTYTFSELLSKPTTIAGYGITDIPTTLPASDVYAWAKAATKPSYAYSEITGLPSLFSGAYVDLTGKPTIPAAQVNSDWNAVSGVSQILNKPTLFSGAYADLTGKPSLTSGTVTSVAALTLGSTGTDITSSVANATTSPTITLNIPTASITNRGLLSATDWSTFNSKGDMTLAGIQTVTGSKTFSNTIIGSINGNAATATKLATPVTINGTSFDGSGNINISVNTTNALTFNNIGSGDVSGNTFNGSAIKTISYNSIGAAPLAGSTSITTLGTISSGTWNGTTIAVANGGTGATTHSSNGVLIGNGTSAFTTVAPSTSGNVLTSNGTNWVSSSAAATVREVANEFTATSAQTSFTLSQTPSVNSKVKMFVNGVRISNTAYSVSGTTLTYNPTNNGGYALSAADRIQFDYYY